MISKNFTWNRVLIGLLFLSFILCYFIFFIFLSGLYPKTADQVNYFLAGVDLANGNWRLKGWILTQPDFWTSDIILSAVLSKLSAWSGHSPNSPLLIIIQPAITWTILWISACWMVLTRLSGKWTKFGSVLLIATSLAFPIMHSTVMYFITLSAIHLGSLVYCLWAFHFADQAFQASSMNRFWKKLFICFLMLFLGRLSDPLVMYCCAIPLFGVCILTIWEHRKRSLYIGMTAIAAIGLAKIVLIINSMTGGFQLEALPGKFAPFSQLSTNISVTLQALLQLFSADFFDKSFIFALPEMSHLPIFLLSFGLISVYIRKHYRAIFNFQDLRRYPSYPIFGYMLIFGAIFNLFAVGMSNMIATGNNSIAAARYLFSFWVFMTMAVGIHFSKYRFVQFSSLAAFVLAIISNASLYQNAWKSFSIPQSPGFLTYLEQKGFTQGIGTYWYSTNLTMLSRGKVKVMAGIANTFPDIANSDAKINPFVHITAYYDFKNLQKEKFFVLLPHPFETYNDQMIVKTFGKPDQIEEKDGMSLYLYNTHL